MWVIRPLLSAPRDFVYATWHRDTESVLPLDTLLHEKDLSRAASSRWHSSVSARTALSLWVWRTNGCFLDLLTRSLRQARLHHIRGNDWMFSLIHIPACLQIVAPYVGHQVMVHTEPPHDARQIGDVSAPPLVRSCGPSPHNLSANTDISTN